MAEKESLLSNLMGKRRGCCCQVKIEEIPEGEDATARSGDNDGSNQGCCEVGDGPDRSSKK